MSYSETFALAKEQEEAELLRPCRTDIVQQVLRRLAQANPAGPAASPPPLTGAPPMQLRAEQLDASTWPAG